MKTPPLRIAAAADLHYTKSSKGQAQKLLSEASHAADVLLLCGDLTDYGHRDEAHLLAQDIRIYATVPVVAILGNHDFEAGHPEEVSTVLEEAGVQMLDGACTEVRGVGFAGVCGFGGGFGSRMLTGWGEPLIKAFVQESVDHAMHLERALARLQTRRRIALLHYSPIRETVEGEPPEIFPFLGSSRLESPLNRLQVDAAFHGHAHRGRAEGKTSLQVPVYNVALPVLARTQPEQPLFRLLTLTP